MAVESQGACGRQDGLSMSLLERWLVGNEACHNHGAAGEIVAVWEAVLHAAVVQVFMGVEYI